METFLLIGISGKRFSGKDTLGTSLHDFFEKKFIPCYTFQLASQFKVKL